jgi:hypothetical protein
MNVKIPSIVLIDIYLNDDDDDIDVLEAILELVVPGVL